MFNLIKFLMNTIKPKLFIQADNIHSGGGESLLNALMKCNLAKHAIFILDSRKDISNFTFIQPIKVIKPTIFKRLFAQLWLWRNLKAHDVLLCFGNLPPLFRIKAKVVVFVQNIYIITDKPLNGFSLKMRIRIGVERFWFRSCCHKVSEFVVQSSSMQVLLKRHLSSLKNPIASNLKVQVLPFMNFDPEAYLNASTSGSYSQKRYDFIYPASGEIHKNHQKLIEAFVILSEEGYFPSLVLTLDPNKFPYIVKNINIVNEKYKLNIYNFGFLSHKNLLQLYRNCSQLIFPSLFESFGVPLLEAKKIQLPIIAAELDYVRDFVDPKETFDPNSSLSIARAIKRSLGVIEVPVTPLSADEFLSIIF